MNDRCAAGTGRFVEVMAATFDLSLEEFIHLAQKATDHIPISSMCTVFAESEVVSLITSGKPRDKIALGVHVSIADRLASMLSRFSSEGEVLFVGGGALNSCLHALLEKKIGKKIMRPQDPQLVVAFGAALLAEEI
jgi:predicted CoA-substrate-specific enzyme activase